MLESNIEDGKDSITEISIGEMKYTSSASTFFTGLRELLECMHFAKSNAGFMFGEELDSASVHEYCVLMA